MRRNLFICLLLAGITLAVYWPVGRMGFIVYDDPGYIVNNTHIQAGITADSVRWALTSTSESNWHPLTWLSHMLDYRLFGLNAAGPHWVNLAFHIANTGLLFFVMLELTRSRAAGTAPTTGAVWRSALIAALFAWHPMHIQSVAWLSERKDVLSAFFLLLTLWAYARFVRATARPAPVIPSQPATKSKKSTPANTSPPAPKPAASSRPVWFYCLALLFFALGLMSKPMLVTTPLILLVLDFWPLSRLEGNPSGKTIWGRPLPQFSTLGRLLLEKLPFLALTVASCVITLWAQSKGGAVVTLQQLPLLWRFVGALVFYGNYVEKLFCPLGLCVLYLYEPMHLLELVCRATLPVLVTLLIILRARSQPYLLAGWFWFLIMLVPVIGLVQVGGQAIADRYTYLPSIGLFIIVAWAMTGLAARSIFWRNGVVAAAIAMLAFCLVDTKIQLGYWKNSITLFQRAVDTTHGAGGYLFLGCGYEEAGELEAAAINYQIALERIPFLLPARYKLARVMSTEGNYEAANIEYLAAVQLSPNDPLIQQARQKNMLLASVQAQPDAPEPMNNLAWLLATSSWPELRDGARAVQLANRACEIDGNKTTIYIGTLGAAYAEAGKFDDAIATAQRACDLAAKNGEAELLRHNQELLARYRLHEPARE